MSLVNKGYILKLSSYLVREAAGLDDGETVRLEIGAEPVRKMALGAQRERDFLMGLISSRDRELAATDKLRVFGRAAGEIVSRYGSCGMADEGEETCSENPCTYCELVCLVNEAEVNNVC